MALRHCCPPGGMIRMPRPRTRTIASAAFGSAVARLNRPTTGYWPGTNTCALESAEPLPFASNVPVKQMPLAWLRRWPSAGPPGGARPATNLAGVSRCGESQPAVYANARATTPMTTAMIASRATGKGPGGKGDWDIGTSFSDSMLAQCEEYHPDLRLCAIDNGSRMRRGVILPMPFRYDQKSALFKRLNEWIR